MAANAKRQASQGRGEVIDITALRPMKNNARKHNDYNVNLIQESVKELGPARSGVIDENGQILAGHGTLEALKKAGIKKIRVIDGNKDEWIVVRRNGLTEKEKERLSLYDNRTAEFATWDGDILSVIANRNRELLAGLWSEEEIERIASGWAPIDEKETDPENYRDSFILRIEGVESKHRDKLVSQINELMKKEGYEYECEAF